VGRKHFESWAGERGRLFGDDASVLSGGSVGTEEVRCLSDEGEHGVERAPLRLSLTPRLSEPTPTGSDLEDSCAVLGTGNDVSVQEENTDADDSGALRAASSDYLVQLRKWNAARVVRVSEHWCASGRVPSPHLPFSDLRLCSLHCVAL
jgi:hypothetical protein